MKPKSIKFVGMTIQEATQKLLFQLYHAYDNREAANIADWIMEYITGWKKIDRIVNKEVKLSQQMEKLLGECIAALSAHTPVQYVLHEAWFCGMKLYVDENVLIPRPETEELVRWLVNDASLSPNTAQCILDIGTGSGCIAIAIKKQLPIATVHACDISLPALEVAKRNAATHAAVITFSEVNILNKAQWDLLPEVDTLISNPPYIPSEEKQEMNKNVILHEPHQALFVADGDPLLFYKTIADIASVKLSGNGYIYVETHEKWAKKTAELFTSKGFRTEIRKDMQGKERMVKAVLP